MSSVPGVESNIDSSVGCAEQREAHRSRFIYDPLGTVSYGYDTLNRLATVTIGWLNKTETYSYDAAGRHTQANRFNGSQTQYSYDNADRLTSLTHTASSQPLAQYQYTLDANGNRTKAIATEPKLPEKLINNSQTYTYNPQKNRLTSQNSTTSGRNMVVCLRVEHDRYY